MCGLGILQVCRIKVGMKEKLVTAVEKSDLQTCLLLLMKGPAPAPIAALRDGAGRPLLHCAALLPNPDRAVALTQLLLCHGASPHTRDRRTRRTAAEAARQFGRVELAELIEVWGGVEGEVGQMDTTSTFQGYHVTRLRTNWDNTLTACQKSRGVEFLQQVANVFQDALPVSETSARQEEPGNCSLVEELGQEGLLSSVFEVQTSHSRSRSPASNYSTSTLARPGLPARLNISQVSSIDRVMDDTAEHSSGCGLLAGEETLLCLAEDYLVQDPAHQVELIERRMPSILLQNQHSSHSQPSLDTVDLQAGLHLLDHSGGVSRLQAMRCGTSTASPPPCLASRYPAPLAASLTCLSSITQHWAALVAMEQEMCEQFSNIPDQVAERVNLLTRETACKASFNYLLLDPRVSQDLPLRVFTARDQDLWRTFIAAVFYIGKGSRSRPFQHLYEAVRLLRGEQVGSNHAGGKKKKPPSEKTQRILDIWAGGRGVVVVQVFHNTMAVEAFTREAVMISAVSTARLTNQKPGDCYGPAAAWTEETRQRTGALLLFRAFRIFCQEGERQIRPVDLKC